MAHYWDSVNMIVETSNAEETEWLLRVFNDNGMSPEDWALLPEKDRGTHRPADLGAALEYAEDVSEDNDYGVLLQSQDAMPHLIVFILRIFQIKFEKTEPIILTWAAQCASPRPYSTTGWAVAIFKGAAWEFSAHDAAVEKVKQLGGIPPQR